MEGNGGRSWLRWNARDRHQRAAPRLADSPQEPGRVKRGDYGAISSYA
jgi:hypothetical protein